MTDPNSSDRVPLDRPPVPRFNPLPDLPDLPELPRGSAAPPTPSVPIPAPPLPAPRVTIDPPRPSPTVSVELPPKPNPPAKPAPGPTPAPQGRWVREALAGLVAPTKAKATVLAAAGSLVAGAFGLQVLVSQLDRGDRAAATTPPTIATKAVDPPAKASDPPALDEHSDPKLAPGDTDVPSASTNEPFLSSDVGLVRQGEAADSFTTHLPPSGVSVPTAPAPAPLRTPGRLGLPNPDPAPATNLASPPTDSKVVVATAQVPVPTPVPVPVPNLDIPTLPPPIPAGNPASAPATPAPVTVPVPAAPATVPAVVPMPVPPSTTPNPVKVTIPDPVAVPPMPKPIEPLPSPPEPKTPNPAVAEAVKPAPVAPVGSTFGGFKPTAEPPASATIPPAPVPTVPRMQTFDPVPVPPLVPVETSPELKRPVPTAAGEVRTDFDVDLHPPQAGQTYEAISKQHYQDAKYAEALRAFNKNLDPARYEVQVPPTAVVRKLAAAGRTPAAANPIAPAGGEAWAAPASVGGAKAVAAGRTYTVPQDGMTFRDLAGTLLNDRTKYKRISDLNPTVDANAALKKGDTIAVP